MLHSIQDCPSWNSEQAGYGPYPEGQRLDAASPEWRINASVLAVLPLKDL
jgi:hypothetical protein